MVKFIQPSELQTTLKPVVAFDILVHSHTIKLSVYVNLHNKSSHLIIIFYHP